MRIKKKTMTAAAQGVNKRLFLHVRLVNQEVKVAQAELYADGRAPAVQLLGLASLQLTVQALSKLTGALQAFAQAVELENGSPANRRTAVGRPPTGQSTSGLGSSIDRLMGARDIERPTASDSSRKVDSGKPSLQKKSSTKR